MHGKLTPPNQRRVQISTTLIWMAGSYEFLKKGKEYGETSQLSSCHCTLLNILGGTLGGNHGSKQHLLPHNSDSLHQQTFGLPSYMHQIEIGNYGLLRVDLLAEGRGNEVEAIRCCCSNHCSTDSLSPHREIPGCIAAVKKCIISSLIMTKVVRDHHISSC